MDPSSPQSPSDKPLNGLTYCVPKDWKFWCIIFSLALSNLLTAMEFTSIGAVLPSITFSLEGEQFIWAGSAYALGSSALVPLCGALSQVFGRRPILLSAIILFALGSTICGAATGMKMLIVGRAIQRLGAGAIAVSVNIVLSDLVSLRERGLFNGIMILSSVLGGGVGPVLAGLLAQNGQWRWLFYINVPICILNATLVLLFLRLKTSPGSVREKLRKIDFIGNILVMGSTASVVIGLTWGGVRYPWSSARVLSALAFGFVGYGVFIIYEMYVCKPPTVPIVMRMTWTGASGYIQNFIMAMVLATLTFWYAIFFEACKEKSPMEAGVDIIGLSYSASLVSLVTGLVIKETGHYSSMIYVGWILILIGAELLTTLGADSSIAKAIGIQVVIGSGIGMVYVAIIFPVLASVPVTETAPAMTLYSFTRNFGSIWGVTAGGAIVQNGLKQKLPAAFLAKFSRGADITPFETIPPIIPSLEQPMKDEVREAFGLVLGTVWQAVLVISIVGTMCNIGMKQLKLHTEIDKDWGRDESEPDKTDDRIWLLQSPTRFLSAETESLEYDAVPKA